MGGLEGKATRVRWTVYARHPRYGISDLRPPRIGQGAGRRGVIRVTARLVLSSDLRLELPNVDDQGR